MENNEKLTFLMATVGAAVLTFIATAISVGACHWGAINRRNQAFLVKNLIQGVNPCKVYYLLYFFSIDYGRFAMKRFDNERLMKIGELVITVKLMSLVFLRLRIC